MEKNQVTACTDTSEFNNHNTEQKEDQVITSVITLNVNKYSNWKSIRPD